MALAGNLLSRRGGGGGRGTEGGRGKEERRRVRRNEWRVRRMAVSMNLGMGMRMNRKRVRRSANTQQEEKVRVALSVCVCECCDVVMEPSTKGSSPLLTALLERFCCGFGSDGAGVDRRSDGVVVQRLHIERLEPHLVDQRGRRDRRRVLFSEDKEESSTDELIVGDDEVGIEVARPSHHLDQRQIARIVRHRRATPTSGGGLMVLMVVGRVTHRRGAVRSQINA
jgi:hypothetical protein